MGEYYLFGSKGVGSSPGAYQVAKTSGVVASRTEFERFDKREAVERRKRTALRASETAIVGLLREPDLLGPGNTRNAFPATMPTRETLAGSRDMSAEIGKIVIAQDSKDLLESFGLMTSAELVGAVSADSMSAQ